MRKSKIVVVDYGVGNLFSVQRALEYCGANSVFISSDPTIVADADHLILPGVGSFEDGMRGLTESGLIQPIIEYAQSGRPLLGICLGMQMLATQSEEFGIHQGLGLIPGRVVPIPNENSDGNRQKIPFIGWSTLEYSINLDKTKSIFSDTHQRSSVYLVHSYYFKPEEEIDILAIYEYGGHPITAAVKRSNITGLQFHPEKSGNTGLRILNNFLQTTAY